MEGTKVCFKCGIEKPLSEFYKHKQMADGHLNKCKSCNKSDVQKNYRKNIDHYKLYDSVRNEERRDYIKEKNDRYRENNQIDRTGSTRKYKEIHPERRAAHVKVGNAIRDGKLTKQPCEICGIEKVEAHHEDYSKPLDVMWLCKRCHEDWHIEKRRKAIIARMESKNA